MYLQLNTLKPGEPGNPAVPGGPGGPLKSKRNRINTRGESHMNRINLKLKKEKPEYDIFL